MITSFLFWYLLGKCTPLETNNLLCQYSNIITIGIGELAVAAGIFVFLCQRIIDKSIWNINRVADIMSSDYIIRESRLRKDQRTKESQELGIPFTPDVDRQQTITKKLVDGLRLLALKGAQKTEFDEFLEKFSFEEPLPAEYGISPEIRPQLEYEKNQLCSNVRRYQSIKIPLYNVLIYTASSIVWSMAVLPLNWISYIPLTIGNGLMILSIINAWKLVNSLNEL